MKYFFQITSAAALLCLQACKPPAKPSSVEKHAEHEASASVHTQLDRQSIQKSFLASIDFIRQELSEDQKNVLEGKESKLSSELIPAFFKILRADLQPLLGHPVDASGDLKKQAFNIQEALLSVGLFLHIDSTIVEGKSVFFTALYPALNTSARDTASITPERLKNFPHLQIFQADQEVAATPLFEPNLAASIHIDVGSANQRSFIVLNNHYISVSAAESGCTFSSGRQLVLDRELNKTPK